MSWEASRLTRFCSWRLRPVTALAVVFVCKRCTTRVAFDRLCSTIERTKAAPVRPAAENNVRPTTCARWRGISYA